MWDIFLLPLDGSSFLSGDCFSLENKLKTKRVNVTLYNAISNTSY